MKKKVNDLIKKIELNDREILKATAEILYNKIYGDDK